MVLSDILMIEDSNQESLICILRDEKCILKLEIDSLKPKDTFPYPGYISRTIRTTLKNHSKINYHLDLYWILLSERLQKGLNRVILGLVFCDFLDSGS